MATTLTVRGVPVSLHAKLKRRADRHRRSLNSELLTLLEESVDRPALAHEVWERIRSRRAELPPLRWNPEDLKSKMREGLG